MTVQAFYQAVGGNYEEVMSRLMTEQRVMKYLRKLPQSDDVAQMNLAFDQGRWEEAFRFSHNVKGMALNLSLTVLAAAASDLCETVRNGPPTVDFLPLLVDVNGKYQIFLDALAQLEG